MTDPLLNWYNKELEFFRQMGAEFARSKPKIASRLSLDAVDKPDPHVERMVQAFAYLNARIRYKLDDDFPELTDAILGVLYPHFLQPVPSLSILQFELDESQGDLTQGHRIPRGTAVESERVDDETCRFQTTSDLTLYPLTCSARLQSRPFSVPPSPRSARAEARLRLELTPFDKAAALSAYGLQTLRCHIHLAQFQQAAELYELLFDAVLGIVVASSDDDRDAVFLPAEHLSAGGFDESDALVPSQISLFRHPPDAGGAEPARQPDGDFGPPVEKQPGPRAVGAGGHGTAWLYAGGQPVCGDSRCDNAVRETD